MTTFFRDWKRTVGRLTLVVGCVFAGLSLVVLLAVWRHATMYPYGRSHCCDKGLYFALLNYADAHDGAFPSGASTPEASLSLLYSVMTVGKNRLADANLLRGKSVPEETVQEILDRGQLLGPDSCGWHYVEGLDKERDLLFAIFWDKAGLDHNGGVLPNGGHIVWFVNGDHRYIPSSEWSKFLVEQQELFDQREKETKNASVIEPEEPR